MATTREFVIFDNITFADLLKKIHFNSESRSREIILSIAEARDKIRNNNDAVLLMPIIKDLLDVAVKNDEQLVKLAAIIQRMMSSSDRATSTDDFIISDEEKNELLAAMEDVIQNQMKSENKGKA